MARIKYYNKTSNTWEYADITGTSGSTLINEHNQSELAHSNLFNEKLNQPNKISLNGNINVTISDNTEYRFDAVTSLTLIHPYIQDQISDYTKAHGFIRFNTPNTITISGFEASSGDDITTASSGQVWEFNTNAGYIIWKKW